MTSSRIKNVSINVAVMVFSLVVSLVIVELSVRGLQALGMVATLTGDAVSTDGPPLQKHNAKLKKSDNPLLALEYDKSHPAINEYGMRDGDYTLRKEKQVTRVAVMGDSVTFGLGVELEDTYVKQLEQALNESVTDGDRQYQVMNFGVSGYSTESELELYRVTASQFEPDAVIVGYVMNDPIPTDSLFAVVSQSMKETREFEKLAGFSQVLAWIKLVWERAITSINLTNIYDPFYKDDGERWKTVVDSFQEFKRLSKQDDFELVVVVFPMLYKFDDYIFQDYHQQVLELLDGLDIDYIDLLPEYSRFNYTEFRIIEADGTHPNEFGHQLAAEKLYQYYTNKAALSPN